MLVAGTAAAQDLRIGVISAKSGVFALFGTSGERGAVLAAEEINGTGGVLGRKLDLMLGDDKSKPEESSRLFREMVANGAVVVVGVIGSGETQAVSTLAAEQKVPFFTGLGYSRFLTEEAGHRYFFRLISNSRAYYGPMVDRLVQAGYVKYCTINNDFAFGRDLNVSVMGDVKKQNPNAEILGGCEFWVPLGTTDFSTYLTAILSKRPQIVMFGGLVGPSGRAFVSQAAQFGLFAQMAGAHPALGWPANNAGLRERDIPKRTIITGSDYPYPPVDTAESRKFHEAYSKRWGEGPMSEGAHGYATIYFIKSAFEKAGKIDREAFVEAAKGLSFVHPSLGKLAVRPFDNQSNAGVWVGYLGWSKEHNRPGMEEVTYVPGDKYLPNEDQVKALRAKK
jgi:branched-chain amino acid transport system substrate-binding protein